MNRDDVDRVCETLKEKDDVIKELLAALNDAVEFIRGSNECLEPASGSGDQEWIDHCVLLQESCEEAIALAKEALK